MVRYICILVPKLWVKYMYKYILNTLRHRALNTNRKADFKTSR